MCFQNVMDAFGCVCEIACSSNYTAENVTGVITLFTDVITPVNSFRWWSYIRRGFIFFYA